MDRVGRDVSLEFSFSFFSFAFALWRNLSPPLVSSAAAHRGEGEAEGGPDGGEVVEQVWSVQPDTYTNKGQQSESTDRQTNRQKTTLSNLSLLWVGLKWKVS